MPTRGLKDSICTSDSIDALTPRAEVLFYRLMVSVDDFGVLDARFSILRARCFPLKRATHIPQTPENEQKGGWSDVSDHSLVEWLNELIENHLIFLYLVNSKPYLQITSWEKYQRIRNKNPKYPLANDGELLTNARELLTSVGELPQIAAPARASVSESESESGDKRPRVAGKPPGSSEPPEFPRFWAAWPAHHRKADRGKCAAVWAKAKLDFKADEIVAHVEGMKLSEDWRKEAGRYVPAPLVYLNRRSWEAPLPAGSNGAGKLDSEKAGVLARLREEHGEDVQLEPGGRYFVHGPSARNWNLDGTRRVTV